MSEPCTDSGLHNGSPWRLYRRYALPAPQMIGRGGYGAWKAATKEETLWLQPSRFACPSIHLEVVVAADSQLNPPHVLAWVHRLLIEAEILGGTIVEVGLIRDRNGEIMPGRIRVDLWERRN